MSEEIVIRDAVPADRSFIFATWLRGLRYGNDWFQLIEKDIYYRVYHVVLERIVTTPGVQIKVACLKTDPDVILGYCIYRGTVLDWIFCKKAWRNIGIAKKLVPSEINAVSHITKTGRSILAKKTGIIFNPFSF